MNHAPKRDIGGADIAFVFLIQPRGESSHTEQHINRVVNILTPHKRAATSPPGQGRLWITHTNPNSNHGSDPSPASPTDADDPLFLPCPKKNSVACEDSKPICERDVADRADFISASQMS